MDLKRHAEESQCEPVSGNVAFHVVRHDPTKLPALVFTEIYFRMMRFRVLLYLERRAQERVPLSTYS
jgi:hypothetical protein